MSTTKTKWTVNLKVYRKKGQKAPYYDQFTMEVDPDEYVLDAIERIWAFHDRSLTFRHACHHSTCGACGMLVNGVEKLTCITYIRDVVEDGGTIVIDPLRNFPIISDLVVDMSLFFDRMEMVGQRQVIPIAEEIVGSSQKAQSAGNGKEYLRLSDCIECGMCISACPIAATNPDYLGPAVLAGAQQSGLDKKPELLQIVDQENGLWRCHSAYECTAVCPSNVDPAWRIMDLRRQVTSQRFKRLFR
jgi:succinate dehydrogenase / fumarate reductase iron-sulfur subunit